MQLFMELVRITYKVADGLFRGFWMAGSSLLALVGGGATWEEDRVAELVAWSWCTFWHFSRPESSGGSSLVPPTADVPSSMDHLWSLKQLSLTSSVSLLDSSMTSSTSSLSSITGPSPHLTRWVWVGLQPEISPALLVGCRLAVGLVSEGRLPMCAMAIAASKGSTQNCRN